MSDFSSFHSDPTLMDPQAQQGMVPGTKLNVLTQPFGNELLPTYYYYYMTAQSMRNGSMHRKDGKKLAFLNGVCKTNLLHDVEYFEEEVHIHQNPFLRRATADEINAYEMQLNPKGFMREQVEREFSQSREQDMRRKLEREIRQELAAKYNLQDIPIEEDEDPNGELDFEGDVGQDAQDLNDSRLSGVDALRERAKQAVLKSVDVGSGQLTMTGGAAAGDTAGTSPSDQRPPIVPVGSDKLGGAAASSTGAAVKVD